MTFRALDFARSDLTLCRATYPFSMRRLPLFSILVLTTLLGGCKPKEITPLARKQGANFASEANFAISVRDYARAENLLAQATAVCPDTPEYWIGLGAARRRLDNRSGAKAAYEEALKASRAASKRDAKNPQPLLQQVYVLALLGREADARALLDKARTTYPENRNIRTFFENKELDRLLADPGFKELAP
jgi:tetratricopeptide (TPR) repeat protein